MNIQDYATNVVWKDGIWYSKDHMNISYPDSGNSSCFQIEDESFWFRHRNQCIIEAVKKYSPDKVFFDIGGGNGFVSMGLEQNGISTVLIEPGPEGANNARKRGLPNIICSTFELAGIRDNSIEAAGLFDVVEHIEDDLHFLKSIHKIMKPSGKLYITVPAYNMLWSAEDTYAGHFRRYTLSSLGQRLKEAGFNIIYSTYIFSILPAPVLLFRTIPSKLGIHKNPADVQGQKKEHTAGKGILSGLIDRVWQKELQYIKQAKRIPIGGSCFVVAEKVQ